ncbi:hypothetical protein HK099_005681 [Clydaea vesicula]|uniref:Uncharacterized protein n=1 Tax=Clydaea vesicula TaxID=447962 RepID=A0AAD5TYU4_9FUNG|nr:hypothetical protein HK099_005681 [Clydaea vesicula]KAJ3379993.1 hypothetical protein HDU92_006243 [Lobulomyces angularis]
MKFTQLIVLVATLSNFSSSLFIPQLEARQSNLQGFHSPAAGHKVETVERRQLGRLGFFIPPKGIHNDENPDKKKRDTDVDLEIGIEKRQLGNLNIFFNPGKGGDEEPVDKKKRSFPEDYENLKDFKFEEFMDGNVRVTP